MKQDLQASVARLDLQVKLDLLDSVDLQVKQALLDSVDLQVKLV